MITKTNNQIVKDFEQYPIGACKVYNNFYPSVNLNITKYNDGIGFHYYNALGRLVNLGFVQIIDLCWKLNKI